MNIGDSSNTFKWFSALAFMIISLIILSVSCHSYAFSFNFCCLNFQEDGAEDCMAAMTNKPSFKEYDAVATLLSFRQRSPSKGDNMMPPPHACSKMEDMLNCFASPPSPASDISMKSPARSEDSMDSFDEKIMYRRNSKLAQVGGNPSCF